MSGASGTNTVQNNQSVEQKIAQYLKQHPDFFNRHPELLDEMKLTHEVYGSVSLVERQILKLRQRSDEMQKKLNLLVANAGNNSELLNKCTDLCVSLIGAQSQQQMVDTLLAKLTYHFAVDNCQLWLCDDNGTLSHVNYTDLDTIRQLTDQRFINHDPVCGRVTESIAQLFGGDNELQSYAMIPLGEGAENGVIVLGSKQVDLFTADMGTLFLSLIGDVTEARLASYQD
ncbi:MAG: DUF484 family protein [Kangiellaceae bacterium]|nr:DUF484 family protein [Kangiellaceae bacterium]